MEKLLQSVLSLGPEFMAAAQANQQGAWILLVFLLVAILAAKK